MKIFSGSSHAEFAKGICDKLGIELGKANSFVFSNSNRFITIDEPVRGQDVFVVQTSYPPHVDVFLMELLMFIRTLRDSSAGRVTAVLPYFPYIRSDKKDQPRVCVTARLVADLLEKSGANRALIAQMHALQMQGFFSIPCDHLLAAPAIIAYLKKNWDLSNYVIVAADAGAVKVVKPYADGLDLPTAIMDKRREANDEEPKIKGVIGDVKDKKVLIIDDEVASGKTLARDAEFLCDAAGALSADACVTHPVLSPGAAELINKSRIDRLLATDTIPTAHQPVKKMETVSMVPVFAECIRRISQNESIKGLNDVLATIT